MSSTKLGARTDIYLSGEPDGPGAAVAVLTAQTALSCLIDMGKNTCGFPPNLFEWVSCWKQFAKLKGPVPICEDERNNQTGDLFVWLYY